MMIRAWTIDDWASHSGIHANTVRKYVAGDRVDHRSVAALQLAMTATAPIPGLADLLERPEVAAS